MLLGTRLCHWSLLEFLTKFHFVLYKSFYGMSVTMILDCAPAQASTMDGKQPVLFLGTAILLRTQARTDMKQATHSELIQ